MTIDPEFYDLMPSTITIQRWTGEDSFGNNTYGTGEVIEHVRIEMDQRQMATTLKWQGTAMASTRQLATVIMDYIDPPYGAGDLVTLPNGNAVRIFNAEVHYDERGPYYQQLTLENNQEG